MMSRPTPTALMMHRISLQKLCAGLICLERLSSAALEDLNPAKTEFILLGCSADLEKVTHTNLDLLGNNIHASVIVRDLGVTLDPFLFFGEPFSNFPRSSFTSLTTCVAYEIAF